MSSPHSYDPGFVWPDPHPAVTLELTSPLNGCTVCSTQDTATLCSCHGRLCADHAAHPAIEERAS